MVYFYRLLQFSLAVALLFFSCLTFLPFSHGASRFLPPLPAGGENKARYGLELSWRNTSRRSVVEGPIGEPVENPLLVLAPERTYRKDPLDGFKRYTGGWNIRDRHYWASVGFTAVPFFAIAAIWFVLFGLCLLLIFLCHFCCKREPYGYSRAAYALSLIFLVAFTILAVVGCVVLYAGQGRFHSSTKETLEYVVNQADATVGKLKDVLNYLSAAKQIGVDQVFLPSNVQTDIDQIEAKISSSADNVAKTTMDSSDDVKDLVDSVRLALIVTAGIMLVLTFLGFLFSVFGMQFLVYILVILGWILVTGTFILCGTFLLLHNAAADTCVAMEQWVENPTAHTALDDILPCVDNATSQETLMRSKEVTSQLVDLVNEVITNVSNINFAPNFVPMYYNQSGPLLPLLCNPFFSNFTDRACTPGEVDLNNATQVWSSYVCQVSPSGICTTTGRLTPAIYSQMVAAVNVSYALYNYAPFLVQLQDCTFVRQTFSDISRDRCPNLRRYSRWIYIGLVMVSTAVMLSLIFWMVYGRERRRRLYAKELRDHNGEDKDVPHLHETI